MTRSDRSMKYIFESDLFGLSENTVHLLRSRYNYKSYHADEIESLTIKNGRLVNNWLIVLGMGLSCLFFSGYYTLRLAELLYTNVISRIYVEEIVVPVIPFLVGAYCLHASLRTGPTLKIILLNSKVKTLPLDKERKSQRLEQLISQLKNSSQFKNKTTISL